MKRGQARRRLVSWIAPLCVAALASLLAGRALESNPVLTTVPIGSPNFYPGSFSIDPAAGRAFILDDGDVDPVVTVQGNGYSWGNNGASGLTIHVIDTHTGRLAATLSVPDGANFMAVDPYTHRLLIVDAQTNQQLQVFDTRGGRLLATHSYNGGDNIGTTLIDARTGRLFVATSDSIGNPTQYTTQHVLMLDGRSGALLHTYTFPRGRVTLIHSGGGTISSGPPPFTMALDSAAGRLYTFDAARRMSVLDTRSGRMLFTRRLSVVLTGPQVDGRGGRIVADAIPWPPVMPRIVPRPAPLRPRPGTVVLLDARSGAIVRRLPGGSPYDYLGSIGVDPGANTIIAADWVGRAVDILDAASGRLLRRLPLGGVPYQVVVDARRHRAAVDLGANSMATPQRIAILDTRTGALLRTITLPGGFGPLLLDPGSGHLILTASALLPGPSDGWSWMPGWLRDRLPDIPTPAPTLGPNQRILHNTVVTLDPAR